VNIGAKKVAGRLAVAFIGRTGYVITLGGEIWKINGV
jgi:hypothetical protein